METKVLKFGGSSLADAKQFRKVADIINADSSARKYVVPSAPGKRFKGDEKVTDLLYRLYETVKEKKDYSSLLEQIKARYNTIIEELGIELSLENHYEIMVHAMMSESDGPDYAASRGEYLNGLILARYLGYDFIDARNVVFFHRDGTLNTEKTYRVLSEALASHKHAVIPGFYGALPSGKIKTFTRGGSDITGAIVARATMADLYENWTDVSGFLMADPRCIDNPKPITVITYKELRELSYMGATVLHEDAIFPVRAAGIPINIRNTNDPSAPGTMILASASSEKSEALVTGIAGKLGFSILSVEKDMMNSELGFGRRVLEVLEKHKICFEHLPSGIDTMSVVVKTADIGPAKKEILDEVFKETAPDAVSIEDGMALIAVVGRGMVRSKGTAARLFSALANASVNIRMIDQGSSELNIIVGVEEHDYMTAIKAIYDEFVK